MTPAPIPGPTRAGAIPAGAAAACLLLTASLPAIAQQEGASVRGTVTSEDGDPVEAATVILADSIRTLTDASGQYAIAGLPPGSYSLRVEYLGFETVRESVRLRAGESRTFSTSLGRDVIEVANLVVEVPRRRRRWVRGMFDDLLRHHGHLFTRRDIAERDPLRTSDLLRRLPGVHVRGWSETGFGNRVVVRCGGREREPTVYLDGGMMPDLNVDQIPPEQIAAIGLVRGPTVSTMIRGCGAVVILTRAMSG